MDILFIGSSGALSLTPFKSLLSSSHRISAVATHRLLAFENKIIALENESLALAARQFDIPVIDMSQPVNAIVKQLSDHQFDVILMSCFGKRLPAEIINLPTAGCYNMHPSLLPAYRGPEPIFWQLKYGAELGVSWHRVVNEFDAGDIVAQQEVKLEDGASYHEISSKLAEKGAQLMLRFLSELDSGRLAAVPQGNNLASYHPYPSATDFDIDTRYSARQLYNFMRGTEAYAQPYRYLSDSQHFFLDKPLGYDADRTIQSTRVEHDRLYIPCNGGVLIASYTDKITI